MRKCLSVKLFVIIMSVVAGLSAQTYQGNISGLVSDKSGAIIPGATVTVANVEKGTSRTYKTSGAGEYTASNLEPGLYTITVEQAGMRKMERSNVRLGFLVVAQSRNRSHVYMRVDQSGNQILSVAQVAPRFVRLHQHGFRAGETNFAQRSGSWQRKVSP